MKKLKHIFLLLLLLFSLAVFAKAKQPKNENAVVKIPSFSEKTECKPISERKRQEQIYFFHEGKKRTTFNDIKGAVYCYQRAIKADPCCDACFYELAKIAVATNQNEKAIALLQTAYRLDTANVWYAFHLAQQLAVSENFAEATACYEKSIALNPKLQEAYVELMLVYDREKKYDDAVQMLTRYQQNFGVDEASQVSKQGFLYKQGKIDEAIVEAKTLVEMHPGEQRYCLMLAELYGACNADSLSCCALEHAKTLDSTSQEFLMAQCDYYRRSSNFDGYFSSLLTLFSAKETPSGAKLQVLDFLLQFPEVEQKFAPQIDSLYALSRTKYSYQLELLFAKYLLQTKRVDKAFIALKLITARGAYDDRLLDAIKNKRTSRFFVAEALESMAYYQAWNLFLDMLIARREWAHLQKELDDFSTVFSEEKFRVSYLKGVANFQQQRYADALHFWQQAEKAAMPTDTVLLAQLYSSMGDVYFMQNSYAKVDKYFAKSLKLEPNNT
ncbi:MAG: tetratricopeptide repeat protein, partial [Prevotellaceae bacterium]|nr:tetratricopeptide repeat protein [Prevotellaceae bacterium]